MVVKMKKILPIIILLLLSNLALSETNVDNYTAEEFDKAKSGGPQLTEEPRR